MGIRRLIEQIIRERKVTTVFQSIYDLNNVNSFGFEALSRGPSDSALHSPSALFDAASDANLLPDLELICVENAVNAFAKQSLANRLFVNLSHEALVKGSKNLESLNQILEVLSQQKFSIVIELNEKNVADNIEALKEGIAVFRAHGCEIAIDDLGVGHSSLRLWSEIKPDYVKIDRHFINHIDSDIIKQEFVRSMIQVANLEGAQVIAEGVETRHELELLTRLDVSLVQGSYVHRAEPEPKEVKELVLGKPLKDLDQAHYAESLISSKESVSVSARVADVVEQFQTNVSLNSIAVLKDNEAIGMVHRKRFLTEMSRPFAMDLFSRKPISDVMDQEFLRIDANFRIEQASRLVTERARLHAEEDFIVQKKGKYLGMGQVIDLLRQITEIQISTARHANPLTMLPGNVPIGDCVDRLIDKQVGFLVSYFDLDYFKPFNDRYGYAMGDQVLLLFAKLLKKYIHQNEDFVGHIGGDDFISVTGENQGMESVSRVVSEFEDKVVKYYNEEDRQNGGIKTIDRHGEYRFFPLMRVSVGCIEVMPGQFDSYQDVSSKLVTVKGFSKGSNEHDIVLERSDGLYEYISAKAPSTRVLKEDKSKPLPV